ncbi:MAG TPA: 16S rRNA (cytosine(1402)-N(4))-methyltransferase RsmH [Acidimicrobiia bacterium]
MSEEQFEHLPVMSREVVELLLPVPAGLLVDCTVGAGGHSALLLDARPDCSLLGIDRDADAVAAATARLRRFGDRVEMVQGEFGRLRSLVGEREEAIVGVLMDLGVSSPQLDRPERGFSFRFDAPLDMRMDARQSLTAAQVVNEYDEDELAAIIAGNGEERYARRVARSIVAARPLHTTRELVAAITSVIPAASRRSGGHPARRTFQAIRMEVNRELPNLADGLDESVHLVGPGGRILVLAYHSLEDRIVKERMRAWADEGAVSHEEARLPVERQRHPIVRVLTRRPLRPEDGEVLDNPRAESARLRACELLTEPLPRENLS